MTTLLEKGLLVGLGLLSMTREKAQKIVDDLAQRGEVNREEAKEWVDRLVQRGEEERQAIRKLIRDEVKAVMNELGLPTKQDLQDLASRMEGRGKQSKMQ